MKCNTLDDHPPSIIIIINCRDADLQDLVPHDEVRAWLASTFTSKESLYSEVVSRPKPTFKAVVGTIMVGQYFGYD